MAKSLYIPYDSSYIRPLGAVTEGTEVRMKIELPCSLDSTWANLVISKEGGRKNSVPMTLQASDEEGTTWVCAFTPPESGLYFYQFEAEGEWLPAVIRQGSDGCGTFFYDSPLFQLTVYDRDFTTPPFLKGGVMYQIFPDRFCKVGNPTEGIPKDRILREDWGGTPRYLPDEEGVIKNNDYFGGNLRGIRSKLDYLQSLGVTCLYLNPIFEAHSNHRYNTADYTKIDPLLGTEEDFKELCAAAKARGIAVILDGVFSHTGDDSIYFNKEKRYGQFGAYNDPQSSYRNWYQFLHEDSYKSWWGIDTLPEVNEEDPSYLDFICSDKGIARRWLKAGASGWRLDVADELPDGFLDRLRKSIKSGFPDAVIFGEVWEDATTKISHGGRRRYLLGKQLDSVMNYPLRDALIAFVKNGDALGLAITMEKTVLRYPKPSVDILMNFLSTHDIERALTRLAGEEIPPEDKDRQAVTALSSDQLRRGLTMLQLAYTVLFFLPGVPCIYYGDEIGMQGYRDPFNRGCFDWNAVEHSPLRETITSLSRLRRRLLCTKEGSYKTLKCAKGVFCFIRSGGDSLLVLANSSDRPVEIDIPREFHSPKVHAGVLNGRRLSADPMTCAIIESI